MPIELEQTLASAEIVAALHASREYTPDTEIRLESGRNTVIRAVSKNLPVWEDKGWTGVPNKHATRALVGALRLRTAKTTIAVVKESEGTKEAVTLAHHALERARGNSGHSFVDTQVEPRVQIGGAKLSTLTQASAYRAIKDLRNQAHRKETDMNINIIQNAIKMTYKKTPTVAAIWKSIRHPDISRQIRNFLWKVIHGANRVGKYWRHIPELEDRENCSQCGVEESIQHILFECESPGQAEVWSLAKELGP
ncbi:hypothetical protein C8R43DRAFT_908634 [Mycena crocata]|nr:hypothetical protein C8R43DRAFT_908634 [Mycena crocata]